MNNLKAFSETVNFLQANQLYTLEDLKDKIDAVYAQRRQLQDVVKSNGRRIKELEELQRHAEAYAKTKPIYDQLQKIKFKNRRAQFQQEHETELRRFYLAKRKLSPYGEAFPTVAWAEERAKLQAESEKAGAETGALWQEVRQLTHVQYLVNQMLRQDKEYEKSQSR